MSEIYHPPITDAWSGYWTPGVMSTENHQIGIHRTGTVVGTLCATAIATAGFMLADRPTPLGFNIDATFTTTDTVETGRHTDTERKQEKSTTTTPGQGVRVVVERKETAMMIQMPDVPGPGFDLNKAPETQYLLNPEDIPHFNRNLKRAQAEGWTLTRPKVEGESSDETRQTPDADIGRSSGQQDGLALQYAGFVRKAWEDAMAKDGIVLSDDIQMWGAEHISTPAQQADLAEALRESGLPDNRALIDAYKTNPMSLPLGVRLAMNQFQRGATISVILSREVLKPVTYERTDTRCVDETVTNITTKEASNEHGGNLPLTIVPFPVFGRRRRPSRLASEAEIVSASVPAEVVKESLGRSAVSEKPDSGATGRSDPDKWMDDYEAWRRVQKRLGVSLVGAMCLMGAVVAVGLRLDAGYCPNPEKYAEQDYDTSKNEAWIMPDVAVGHLQIPFTDIKSGDFLVFGDFYCPGPNTAKNNGNSQQNPGNGRDLPQIPTTPTCDTRSLVFRDGNLISSKETHHSTAISSVTAEK